MGFRKPHSFSRDEVIKNAAPISAFVAAAPVETPVTSQPASQPKPPPAEPRAAAAKKPQVKPGYKKETVIFPNVLSAKIRELGAEEFKDFSAMLRDLVVQSLRARGVSFE